MNKDAPIKRRYVRPNKAEFIDIELNHAIMLRSKLRIQYLKKQCFENREA